MEMFELRYFFATAQKESLSDAAKTLSVSSSAISKAITRLEVEFGTDLFEKKGRGVRLTQKGSLLFDKCIQFFELERETKVSIGGEGSAFEIRVAGPEVFLSKFGLDAIDIIKTSYPGVRATFMATDEQTTLTHVISSRADFGIVGAKSNEPALKFKEATKVPFQTYISKQHPLYKVSLEKSIPIGELLTYEFLVPAGSVLGGPIASASADGWRDDKFPRKVSYNQVGLKTLERIVCNGKAVAYLPEYLAQDLPLFKLKISGCPYHCEQSIQFVARKEKGSASWLKEFWSAF